ncbi:hypothetical protein HmCmsJML063_01160 [Escherichia coli]|nr:hypothetical protein HmCmsJML063_01160 [Escherichia coli]
MAGHKGHEFMWVKNVAHQLRHEADRDELRAVAAESEEGLRAHFYWEKSRKPEPGQRWRSCCRTRNERLSWRHIQCVVAGGD